MKKKYIIYGIIIVCLLSIFVLLSFKKNDKIITGEFKYATNLQANDKVGIYYYSDQYFKTSSLKMNNHLTTMSLNLTLNIIPSNETDEITNIKDLLGQIGFKDLRFYDLLGETTAYTIGNVIAHKKINNFDVVLVAIRGERYGSEWASDFLAGENGNHKGFEEAKNQIVKRLDDYLKEYDLDKIKIWITGYSRAGAIANLLGTHINEHLDDYNIKEDDLYVYTFEAPNSSSSDKKYNNIYNITNYNDPVNYVPFRDWNLYSNGNVIDITEEKTIILKKLKISLTDFNIEIVDNGEMNKQEFINKFIDLLAHNIDRKLYTENLEKPLSNILERIFKLTDFEMNELKRLVKTTIDKLKNDKDLISIFIGYIFSNNSNDKLINKITATLKSVYETENIKLSKDDYLLVENLIEPAINTFMPIVMEDFINSDGKLGTILTFAYNIEDIISEHYSISTLKKIIENDNYYTN